MSRKSSLLTPVAAALVALLAAQASQAATITISSRDPAGVGFNDPTITAPVGGNTGTTLGQQRFNVYRYVANIWEANLQSNVAITVSAGWEALTCTATSAVLGSAGAYNIWHDFPGGVPGTWYPQALANRLAGVNLSAGIPDDGTGYGNVDIRTQFNVNLGNTGCLDGQGFYLGLDGNAGNQVNFVTTLLHELGHGLGFQALTQTSTGFRILPDGSAFAATGGLPAIWEGFMYDNTVGLTWLQMTNAQRAASAINPLQLAWIGPNAVAGAAQTLSPLPFLRLTSPAPGVTGNYVFGTASFGPAIAPPGALGTLVNVNSLGCTATGGVPASVAGRVAVIPRGTCAFVEKAQNAQNSGAIGVIIVNNAAGAAPGLGGTSATITIPTVSLSQADGSVVQAAIETALRYGSRARPGTVASSFVVDATRRAGADLLGRPLLYTPATLAAGSSVSHWDVSASPNLLMEPAINSDLGITVVPPRDLTRPLFLDIGWQ